MAEDRIVVADAISEEMRRAIGDGLNAFNIAATGYSDQAALAVVLQDDGGVVVGGALGRTYLGLLFLDLFYLPAEHRGAGVGAEILRRFEAEGRRRGCVAGVLYTISFQAPDFYEKHGWRRFGEIACDPAGTSRIFMTKQL